MTVSSTTDRKTFAGDNVTTGFDVSPMVFFNSSDLVVYVVDDASGDPTTLVENTDYVVTVPAGHVISELGDVGLIDLDDGADPWGPLLTGTTLVIVRTVPATQETDFVNNDINDAEVSETAFDKLTMLFQQITTKIGRAFHLADSDVSGADVTLPTPTAYAVPGWNSTATALVNYTLTAGTFVADMATSIGSSLIGFIASGTGAVLRTVQAKLRDQISVKDFGATGDGTTDDTAAINAAITACIALTYKALYFPAGNYKVTSALTSITGNNWRIYGDGEDATRVFGTHNGAVFTIDVSAATSVFGIFEKMAIEGNISGTYSSSASILIHASSGSATGLQYWKFSHLRFRDIYRGIYFEETAAQTVGSFTGISYHQFLTFDEITVPVAITNAVLNTIAFAGSGPSISAFHGGHIRGSGAAIKLGNGNATTAVGDLLFTGVHIVTADVGIDIYGPADASDYNQNVTIVGCQIDNCATATVRMDKMKNFRIGPNNSTSSVGPVLTNCTNYFLEDRNAFTFPDTVNVNAALNITSGAASSVFSSTNGIRYANAVVARRSVDTDLIRLEGGSISGAGAHLDLYGGTHATLAKRAFIDADRTGIRSQNGGTVYLDVNNGSGEIEASLPIKLKSYAVASLPTGTAGDIVYASNGRKAGEGAGAGTGVLVFKDASNWIAVDTGATVAA